MKDYIIKLKIHNSLTEKDKLKEMYKKIKHVMLTQDKVNDPSIIEKLIAEIKDIDLQVAIPDEYFYEALEIKSIEKLHEIYKKRYDEVNKQENLRKECFSKFYKMLD